MRLVYVAAPLSAPTVNLRHIYRDRAALIGRLVSLNEECPIVPHLAVGGLFPRYPARKDDDVTRDLAMRMCLRLVETVALSGGRMVVLRCPDGSISDGCRLEIDRYGSLSTESILVSTWNDWSGNAQLAGLWGEWNSLRIESMGDIPFDSVYTIMPPPSSISNAIVPIKVKP